jgi:hypothetical protein
MQLDAIKMKQDGLLNTATRKICRIELRFASDLLRLLAAYFHLFIPSDVLNFNLIPAPASMILPAS